MSRAGICRIICVIALFVFISFSLSQEKEITVTATEMAEAVTEVISTEALQLFDEAKFEEEFSVSAESLEELVYYGSEDIMNPDEIIIVRIRDTVDPSQIQSAMEKRADDKYNTFKDYDPVSAELLKNRVIHRENNVIFYAVDDNASKALEAFTGSIE